MNILIHKINEELYLRFIQLEDAEKIYTLTNDSRAYLKEWLPWLDTVRCVEDTRKFIQASIDDYAKHKSMNMVIIFQEKVVGVAGFNEINWSNRIAYIGYWLAEKYQGNGIVTKVTKGLTNFAFKELKLNRVEIRVAVGNDKSKAIPERLGFTYEGCIRQAEWLYNHYVDHAVYGLLAEEWDVT